MAVEINSLDDASLQLIHRLTAEVAQLRRDLAEVQRAVGARTVVWEGKLAGNLSVGGTATLDVYMGSGGSWADSGENITVTWPSGVGVAMSTGDYLRAYWINGEWRPATGTC